MACIYSIYFFMQSGPILKKGETMCSGKVVNVSCPTYSTHHLPSNCEIVLLSNITLFHSAKPYYQNQYGCAHEGKQYFLKSHIY